MKLSDIDLINLTNIYIQQNNLAQGINETEFVDKFFEIYKKISNQFDIKLSEIDQKNSENFQKAFY
ncbi:hypothetical protein [Parvimonas sp. D9]|uniref:hypothetical protein n=1 Tax=Parvimonas sp. D9 TaxID=3110689 RepID=UPI002B47DFCC|nr:hypothetical protein [Parvimonas sp. D9]MEB3059212.1 hypothetical protein [Parvimonas sp. D9]